MHDAVSDILPVACKILNAQINNNVRPCCLARNLSLNGRHSNLNQSASVSISVSYAHDVVDRCSLNSPPISREDRVIRYDGPVRVLYI